LVDNWAFVLLGLGLVFLMRRGHGAMRCCGGGHGGHDSGTSKHEHSGDKASRDPEENVIELREDEYTVLLDNDGALPRNRRANSGGKNQHHRSSA
jgi:hypothetical protein